jgi:hypothetical protein
MTEPQQPAAATAHARHDLTLVASLAARSSDVPETVHGAARDLVERCDECRDLLADLLAVQTAVRMVTTPTRPRDFTLTPLDAQRLAPRGWRAALGFFGSARDGFSRPLAVGFTMIGVVALLVTAAPSIPLGGERILSTVGNAVPDSGQRAAAGASEPTAAGPAPAAAPAPSPAASGAVTSAPAEVAAAAAGSGSPPTRYSSADSAKSAEAYATATDGERVFNGEDDGSTDLQSGGTNSTPVRPAGGPSLGVVIAGICLIIGLGLFALRWTSRRFGDA